MRHQKTLRPNEIVLDDIDSALLALARLSVLQFDSLREACALMLLDMNYGITTIKRFAISPEVGLFFQPKRKFWFARLLRSLRID